MKETASIWPWDAFLRKMRNSQPGSAQCHSLLDSLVVPKWYAFSGDAPVSSALSLARGPELLTTQSSSQEMMRLDVSTIIYSKPESSLRWLEEAYWLSKFFFKDEYPAWQSYHRGMFLLEDEKNCCLTSHWQLGIMTLAQPFCFMGANSNILTAL